MSLIFGRLTQDFVNFEIVREGAQSGNADAIAGLPAAAAHFRKASALDASYLVYIGISLYIINLRRFFIYISQVSGCSPRTSPTWRSGLTLRKLVPNVSVNLILRPFFARISPSSTTSVLERSLLGLRRTLVRTFIFLAVLWFLPFIFRSRPTRYLREDRVGY